MWWPRMICAVLALLAIHGGFAKSLATSTVANGKSFGVPVAAPPREISTHLSPGIHSHFEGPAMSPAVHEVRNSSKTKNTPLTLHPVASPAISPDRDGINNETSTRHATPNSQASSSPQISPAPHALKNSPNTALSPSTLHPTPYPAISPTAHEVKNPSNNTPVPASPPSRSRIISPVPSNYEHAPVALHPGSSPVISPVPHKTKKGFDSARTPSNSSPSPPIRPVPGKNLSHTAHAPDTSHRYFYPVISPVSPEVKNHSNTTPAPFAPHPSPSMKSPMPSESTNSSGITPAPSTLHQSTSPVISPAPVGTKSLPNFTHAPLASHPISSPMLGPEPHGVRNSSNSAHAPSTSRPIPAPAENPEPHNVKHPRNTLHPKPPAGSMWHNPASAPTVPTHHHTGRKRVANPAAAPSSAIPPSPFFPVEGPVATLAPRYPPAFPLHNKRHPAPPLAVQGPSPSSSQAPISSIGGAPTLSPSSMTRWQKGGPIHSPARSPFLRKPVAPSPQPVWRLPSPPPNYDCNSLTCSEPYVNNPPGSQCACFLPIKVKLRLGVALYTFFPLVSELAQEIAAGIILKQSQVRIMGANAANVEPEKTIVLVDLVPLKKYFGNKTAYVIYEKFWNKQVAIEPSIFGDYDVLFVHYPGLPASPPTAPSYVNLNDGVGNNGRTIHPFGVDVKKKKEKLSGSLVAVIVLSSVIGLFFVIGAAWLLVLKQRGRAHLPAPVSQTPLPMFAKSSGTGLRILGSRPSSTSASFSSSIATYTGSMKTFTLAEMGRATKRFDDSRIIGEGGFGRVYQGTLEDGTPVAVKVLKRDDQQGEREFLAEVEMLSRLHHRNLVKLLGICAEDLRCLVYELIPNGSVESHLHGMDKETAPLDWSARVKIALGAARGLAYLHEDSSPCVIHRDFKSSNILLEHDFTPKVSDFGLARIAMDGGNEQILTRVMGTFGYVAPEYAMTGHLLVKSEVYSYGVVLLELLTGRKPVDMLQPPGQENLVTWTRPLLTSMEGLEVIIDTALGADVPFDSVAKVAAIASMCVQPEVSHRPFMGEVVQALKLVCSETDEYRPSISCSQEELSAHETDMRISTGLGLESEKVLSRSEVFSTSAWFTGESSSSFRRYSSSGPLRTGKGRKFWQRIRGLSAGSLSDHGVALRSMTGSEDHEQWP